MGCYCSKRLHLILRSIVDYGLEAYLSVSPKLLERLEPIQNHVMRITTGIQLLRKYDLNIDTIYKEVPPTHPPWLLGSLTVCQEIYSVLNIS